MLREFRTYQFCKATGQSWHEAQAMPEDVYDLWFAFAAAESEEHARQLAKQKTSAAA